MKDTGGSAFPESYVGADRPHSGIGDGMTLRDYFAAKAMQSLIQSWKATEDDLCVTAYSYADAMLKARAE